MNKIKQFSRSTLFSAMLVTQGVAFAVDVDDPEIRIIKNDITNLEGSDMFIIGRIDNLEEKTSEIQIYKDSTNKNARNINILNGNINTLNAQRVGDIRSNDNDILALQENDAENKDRITALENTVPVTGADNTEQVKTNTTQIDANKIISESNKAEVISLNERMRLSDEKSETNKLASEVNAETITVNKQTLSDHDVKHTGDINTLTETMSDNAVGIAENKQALSDNVVKHDRDVGEIVDLITSNIDAIEVTKQTLSDHDVKHTGDINTLTETMSVNAAGIAENKEELNKQDAKFTADVIELGQTMANNTQRTIDNDKAIGDASIKIDDAVAANNQNAEHIETANVRINETVTATDNNTKTITENRSEVQRVSRVANNNTNAISVNSSTIQSNHKKAMSGITISMATEISLPQKGKNFSLNLSMAEYEGTSAIGVTGAGRLNDSVTLFFGYGTDVNNNHSASKVGVNYQW